MAEEQTLKIKIPRINPWMIATIILAVALIAVLATGFSLTGKVALLGPNYLTPEEAAKKAVEWITNYFKSGGNDVKVELINATDTGIGVYKFTVKLSSSSGSVEETYYVSTDGSLFFPQVISTRITATRATQPQQQVITIGNFLVSEDEICKEDGKPIVYFFGSQRCPHCVWEHPIVENVTAKFEGYISFHNNMDSDADREIFSKYSTGGIPTIVIGCKYYRVGAGRQLGEEQEAKVLTALICKLTENKPQDVCSVVQDLVREIP